MKETIFGKLGFTKQNGEPKKSVLHQFCITLFV